MVVMLNNTRIGTALYSHYTPLNRTPQQYADTSAEVVAVEVNVRLNVTSF